MTTYSILPIYLPIAEVSISSLLIFCIGFTSGIMAGLLGIGGGFISTPLLIAVGISPSVAVATSAYQIIGASFSGILPRVKTKKIDFKLGSILALFGIVGAYFGVLIFEHFYKLGNIDVVISLFYIILMFFVSFLSFKSYFAKPSAKRELPIDLKIFITKFKTAGVQCSILIPILLGTVTGVLVVIMGVGGGFILVPAMISIMKIKNDIAVGTSLLQIFVITTLVVLFHIFKTGLLDIVLGAVLIFGASIGAQISSIISLKIGKRRIINLILALITLFIALKFVGDIFLTTKEQKILIEEVL